MFAHAATFTIRKDRWGRALGTLRPAKAEIAAIPGLRLWLAVADPHSGERIVVAVFEDEASHRVTV